MLAWGVAACCAPPPPSPAVNLSGLKTIQIAYKNMGWVFVEEDFTITPTASGDGFVLRGQYHAGRGRSREVDRRVSSDAVSEFVRQLTARPWRRDKAMHTLVQRIDRSALREFEPVSRVPPSRCSDDELAMLAKRDLGRAGLTRLVGEHYQRRINWTDDYPLVTVRMTWRDRPAVVMSTHAQQTPMIPWDRGLPMDTPPERGGNWSLPLSTTLQALLPPDSRIHARLDGTLSLERRLGRIAMWHAESMCRTARPTRIEETDDSTAAAKH